MGNFRKQTGQSLISLSARLPKNRQPTSDERYLRKHKLLVKNDAILHERVKCIIRRTDRK